MKDLPVASKEPARAHGAPPPPPPSEVSSLRLVATLAVAGALAGLLIFSVFGWADPRIQAHRAEVLRGAIQEVLGGPEGFTTLFVHQDRLVESLPPGVDSASLEQVYLGHDASGRPVGFAIPGAEPGFQDLVRLIFGYDPVRGEVLGMRVLESKETPGLGDKIIKDSSFVAEFAGAAIPLEGVKGGGGDGDPNEVDMITGATISSRTVIDIINHRLERLRPLLEGYGPPVEVASEEAGGPAGDTGGLR